MATFRAILLLLLGLLPHQAALAAADFEIKVENRAELPAAEIESILQDFRLWAGRVYDYHQLQEPRAVTLRLTRDVHFGFYRDGTVILPPNEDRWVMIDDWVHELSHHATGHDSSFFFKEGIAVHTLEHLFRKYGRVPQPWPQFGQSTDAWVALFERSGKRMPLAKALKWSHYRDKTPDDDFHSWQIYLQAGSFVGWYIDRFGMEAYRKAFTARKPAGDLDKLEQEWLTSVIASKPLTFDPLKLLTSNARYRRYAERLRY